LDEPFNALDVRAVGELEHLIEEHLSVGGFLILTSHQAVNIPGVRVLEL
jgi:heme exporter protein A